MRRKLTAFLNFFVCVSVYCQTSAFPGLTKLQVDDQPFGKMSISFVSGQTQVINKKVTDLDKNDPYYIPKDQLGDYRLMAIKTRIGGANNPEYIVFYSSGPSDDPEYLFYSPVQNGKTIFLFRVAGLNLYLPGDGFIYAEGHSDTNFNKRCKYKVEEGKLVEVKQPFYYIGLKTKSLKPLVIYSSTDMKEVVDNIPANTEIEVVYHTFYDPMTQFFLLRTKFGLTGWYKLPEISQKAEYIEGIFFNGD